MQALAAELAGRRRKFRFFGGKHLKNSSPPTNDRVFGLRLCAGGTELGLDWSPQLGQVRWGSAFMDLAPSVGNLQCSFKYNLLSVNCESIITCRRCPIAQSRWRKARTPPGPFVHGYGNAGTSPSSIAIGQRHRAR